MILGWALHISLRLSSSVVSSLDRGEMESLLDGVLVGHLGLCVDGGPYVVPIGFVYHDGRIYFHSYPRGRKVEALRRDPRVCFQVEEVGRLLPGSTPCKFSVEYRSIIAYGRVRFLEEDEEKLEALRLLLRKYGSSEAAEALDGGMLGDVLVAEIAVEEMTGRSSP